MTKILNSKHGFETFEHYDFEFVSDFGFRASDLLTLCKYVYLFNLYRSS